MKEIVFNLMLEECADMPIVFRSAATCYDQETIRWQEGYTDFYVLQFIVGGSGIFRCRGSEYKLSEGCAFFVGRGVEFEYINTGSLKSAFLSTVGVVPETFLASLKDEHLFYESVDVKKYVSMIGEIQREYYLTSKKARLSAFAYELLAEFFSERYGHTSTVNEQIMTYIKNNFTKKLTLSDISANIGISVSKLCHDFKSFYGTSVFTKIKNLRLDYARELILSNGDLKIKDISVFCGFDDFSYFCSAYKKRFGKSPTDDKLG